jgi:hypothetical protein
MNISNCLFVVCIGLMSCHINSDDGIHLVAQYDSFERETQNHVFFIGHSYGHHGDTNNSICAPVYEFLNQTVWDSTKAVILGGDVFREASPSAWLDFNEKINRYSEKTYFTIGNHDLALRDSINQIYPASIELDTNTQLVLMDFEKIPYDLSVSDCNTLIELLDKPHFKNHIIVGHKVWWLGPRLNKGADNHNRNYFRSTFWEKVFPAILDNGNNYYFLAGDLGGNDGIPPLYYQRIKNVHLLGQGIGHSRLKSVLKIELESDSLNFLVIDLDTSEEFILNEGLVKAHELVDITSPSLLSKIFRRIKSILS